MYIKISFFLRLLLNFRPTVILEPQTLIYKAVNMKRQRKLKQTIQWISISSTLVTIGLILFIRFSPYKTNGSDGIKKVSNSIIINKPAQDVFNFMSTKNSENKWMIYVDHIVVLKKNSDSKTETGNVLRYYCNTDETGQQYDAKIIKSVKNKERKLKIYNYVDFPLALNEVVHQQLYRSLPENKCELNMSIYYNKKHPGFFDEMKAHIASYRIKKIIHENMLNLKAELEGKPEISKN